MTDRNREQQTPAKIILVTNQKGGSSKTTTAVTLAAALHETGQKVLIVDADPQGSVVRWMDNGQGMIPFPYLNLSGAKSSIQRELKKHLFTYDYIVVDGRPSLEIDISLLIVIADIVVIPLKPTQADLDATEQLIQEVERAKVIRDDLKYVLLLTQVMGKTRLLLKLTEEFIEDKGYPLLKTRVAYRECHPQAYTLGKTVFDINSYPNRSSAAEARKFTAEILEMIK